MKPPVPFSKNASKCGLTRGRIFDRQFRETVQDKKKPTADVRKALLSLKAKGVVPIHCQRRVYTEHNNLTTLIDAVGIEIKPPHNPVCIEIKTCQMPLAHYEEYCKSKCRKTPMLRCTPSLPNTERVRHCLQAAYGALALSKQIQQPVSAMVLVLCKDGVNVFAVPKRYMIDTLFCRLTAVKQTRMQRVRQPKNNEKWVAKPWTAQATACIKKYGFNISGKNIAKNVKMIVKGTTMIGVVTSIEKWHALNKHKQESIYLGLKNACKMQSHNFVKATKLTLLVVTSVDSTSPLQVTMAGPPYCR